MVLQIYCECDRPFCAALVDLGPDGQRIPLGVLSLRDRQSQNAPARIQLAASGVRARVARLRDPGVARAQAGQLKGIVQLAVLQLAAADLAAVRAVGCDAQRNAAAILRPGRVQAEIQPVLAAEHKNKYRIEGLRFSVLSRAPDAGLDVEYIALRASVRRGLHVEAAACGGAPLVRARCERDALNGRGCGLRPRKADLVAESAVSQLGGQNTLARVVVRRADDRVFFVSVFIPRQDGGKIQRGFLLAVGAAVIGVRRVVRLLRAGRRADLSCRIVRFCGLTAVVFGLLSAILFGFFNIIFFFVRRGRRGLGLGIFRVRTIPPVRSGRSTRFSGVCARFGRALAAFILCRGLAAAKQCDLALRLHLGRLGLCAHTSRRRKYDRHDHDRAQKRAADAVEILAFYQSFHMLSLSPPCLAAGLLLQNSAHPENFRNCTAAERDDSRSAGKFIICCSAAPRPPPRR